MFNPQHAIFIHGLEGTSQGAKASLLRAQFPEMLIPDFPGDLSQRMAKLEHLLGDQDGWTIIGSSFGGLMGALFTAHHPEQVRKLVMFAPALIWPDFAQDPPDPVDVPVIVYHGRRDEIIPLALARPLAEQVFHNLDYRVVNDDHGLYRTTQALDWTAVLA